MTYPWTNHRVVAFRRVPGSRRRAYLLDCGHYLSPAVVNGRRSGIDCPCCATEWWNQHGHTLPARLRALPAWRRVAALVIRDPGVGVRSMPVQCELLPSGRASA